MLRLLVAALCLRGALPAGPSLLEAHEHNAPIVYSLDASPGLVDHAFSAVASLSSHAGDYPGRVQRVLELLCCSQHCYAVDRPELARSMGNHARFFAYLALLPLGVRRAMFLDVDTLAHDDVAPLMASPLDEQKFPCDALPNRLCPSPKTEATAREREDATKALKNACVAVNAADAKDKRPKAPCSCKGKHFTDVLMPKA
ncbi:hypothetical protein JL721_12927 [Aureococcus anophagefferens]|nr:hypothetical protein JL721_12927 [Aureococcus anophagefferens]